MLLNYKQTFQDIQENSFLETLNGLNKTILVLKAIAMFCYLLIHHFCIRYVPNTKMMVISRELVIPRLTVPN